MRARASFDAGRANVLWSIHSFAISIALSVSACGNEATPAAIEVAPDLSATPDDDVEEIIIADGERSSVDAATTTFVGDFETGTLNWDYELHSWRTASQWELLRGAPPGDGREHGAQVSVSQNPMIVRQGQFAGRFILNPGDIADPGRTTNERLEVRASLAQSGAHEGADAWYGWSVYFPSTFLTRKADRTPGNAVFSDFKPSGTIINDCIGNATYGYLTPPAVFRVYGEPNEKPRIELTIAGGKLTPTNPANHECTRPDVHAFVLVDAFESGRWYDFVYHVRWSSDPKRGFIEVWIDGARVLAHFNAATLYEGAEAYFKQGLYRAASPDVSWIVIDGSRRGSSYLEAAP